MTGHDGPVYGVAFSPDGQLIVSGGADGTVRAWATGTGELIGATPPGEAVFSVGFSPDGQLIVSGGADGTVRVRDAATLDPVGEPVTGPPGVWSVAFGPDGRRIISGSTDSTVEVWDAGAPGRRPGTRLRCTAWRSARTGSASPRAVMTGRYGSGTHTGHAASPPMTGHDGPVYGVAFSPDGQLIVSGGADGTVQVWDVNRRRTRR